MATLTFLVVLFVLVLVHEFGHFIVAKWTGMRVDEFGIGFPPKLFGIKKGETEYTFNLFPIGGFVKIFGENYEETSQNAHSAPEEGSFASKSKKAQAGVLVAGVTMNILFAWLLIMLSFMIGVQTAVSPEEATENAKLTITSVLPDSPAAKAHLTAGSVIKNVTTVGDTLETFTPAAFSTFVSTHADTEITIVYTKKGEPMMVKLIPTQGIIQNKPDQYAIGVALVQTDTIHRSILASITEGTKYTFTSMRDIVVGTYSLLYDAIRAKANLTQVAGPVGIVGLVGEASAYGFVALLMFTAFISLNLAVINLLPIPALDGGRLLFVCIEAIKGSPVNPRYAGIINAVGFILLIVFMIIVTWHDVAKLF